MLEDVAADDPFESLVDDVDEIADVTRMDRVETLRGDRGCVGIELDSDDAAFLPLLEGISQRGFAASELEHSLRLIRNAVEQILT